MEARQDHKTLWVQVRVNPGYIQKYLGVIHALHYQYTTKQRYAVLIGHKNPVNAGAGGASGNLTDSQYDRYVM
jgi:hypothetical protein